MKNSIFIKTTKINVPVETLFLWHSKNGVIERLTPPWTPLKVISKSNNGIKTGTKVTLKLSFLNIPIIFKAKHIEYQKNRLFKDCQAKGPFAKWEHTHIFTADGESSSIMEDRVEFKLPFGFLSWPLYGFARKELKRMFSYRHRVLKYDLEQNRQKIKKRVLISGASGAIGSELVPFLQTCGYEVIRLVRNSKNLSKDELFWDPYKSILELEKAGPIDAVINLNGMDISKGRWTKKQKQLIIDSRTIPTKLLVEKINALEKKPEVFISASAIGIYGKGEKNNSECFISSVCKQWETASINNQIYAQKNNPTDIKKTTIRTVQLRIGVVLTPAGGALKKMALPFKTGLGVKLSHGRQYISWISMDDVLSGIFYILNNNKIKGAVNLTAPTPVTNKEFSTTLARVFSKKLLFTMPKFMVKLLWGQMGEETLLTSINVTPDKLLDSGFLFQHKTILPALKDMLGK